MVPSLNSGNIGSNAKLSVENEIGYFDDEEFMDDYDVHIDEYYDAGYVH